jgi:hypothetical protein
MGKKIPKFRSWDEEAAFWDTTDVTTIDPSELEEVTIDVAAPLSVSFAVRLDAATVAALREVAERRGLGVTQLVRSWILERLAIERSGAEGRRESALHRRIHDRVVERVMAQVPLFVREITEEITSPASASKTKAVKAPAKNRTLS